MYRRGDQAVIEIAGASAGTVVRVTLPLDARPTDG
jgi:hypothetical protein